MAWALVSAPNPGFNAAGTSTSITITPAVASGALVIAGAWAHGTATVPTVSDNKNGSYTQQFSDSTFSTDPSSLNYFGNSASAAANGLVITATASGATSIGLIVEVWTGNSTTPFDTGQHNADAVGSTSMTSNASGTTAGGDELVYGCCMSGGTTETFTAGATYTLDSQANDATVGAMGQESKHPGSISGTQTATFTQQAADVYYCYVAVFKLAPAATGAVIPIYAYSSN